MPTGTTFVNLYNKRILGLNAVKVRFFDYLKAYTEDLGAVLYGEGVFAAVGMAGTVPDKFDLAADVDGEDGDGHHLQWSSASWSFENILAQWYDVGFVYAERPDGAIETNPRTGEYEYVNMMETAGDAGAPDSVAFPGPGLSFVIDTLLGGPGTSHAGRSALIYLKDRAATDNPAVAFETVAIAWVAGQNVVVTAGTLGQAVPSLVAADYRIIVEGPSVRAVGAPATMKGTPGFLYIGSVTGAGAGNVPGLFDVTQQTVFDVVADAAEVLYKDAHGKVKIRVTADAFDVDEPQISVWDNALGNVLTVTDLRTLASKKIELDAGAALTPAIEFNPFGPILWSFYANEATPIFQMGRNDASAVDRKIRISNVGGGGTVGLQLEADFEFGLAAASPGPIFHFYQFGVAESWFVYGPGQTLNLRINSATDATFDIQNVGAGDYNLHLDGELSIDSGVVVSALNPLTFDDSNTGGPISFSETGIGAIYSYHSSVLGALYDFDSMFGEVEGNASVTGFNVTGTLAAPPRLLVSTGTAIVFGNRVVTPTGATVPITPSSAGWVYLNSAGGMVFTTSADTAFTSGLPLYYVVTDPANVTSYQDVRRMVAGSGDDMQEFTVGDVGHFPDFEVAIAFLTALGATTLSTAGIRPRFRLRVVGEIATYAGTGIVIPAALSGIEITGLSSTTRSLVKWNGTGPYFLLGTGLVGFHLHDAVFQYTGAASANSYVVAADSTGTPLLQSVTLRRVLMLPGIGGSSGLFKGNSASQIVFLTVEGCILQADLSLVDCQSVSALSYVLIKNNAFLKNPTGGTPSTTYDVIDLGSAASYFWIEDNSYSNGSNLGYHVDAIRAPNATRAVVRNNVFQGNSMPRGYGVNFTGSDIVEIVGNLFQNSNYTNVSLLSGGIVTGDNAYIIDNVIVNAGDPADAVIRYAIETSITQSGQAFVTISRNSIFGFRGTKTDGIYAHGSANQDNVRITDNVLTSIGVEGIHVFQLDAALVSGNYVLPGADTQPCVGITLNALCEKCIVLGNWIYCPSDDVDGIYVGGNGTIVQGNNITLYENPASVSKGIYDAGATTGNVIVGNRVDGGERGIEVNAGSTGCVISNNRLEDQADYGIYVDAGLQSIGNNSIHAPGIDGIYLTANGDNCTIYGNVVKSPGGVGINLVAGADNNVVIANQASITDSGAGNDVAHNITPP